MTTTFSQMLDELVVELVRGDFLTTGLLPSLLNQTIRELYTKNDGMPIAFDEDVVELALQATTADTYVWQIPNSDRFQRVGAVWYPGKGREAVSTGFVQQRHGIASSLDDLYNYYRSGNSLVFRGFGTVGSEIWWAGFYYVPSLLYKGKPTRLAEYNQDTEQWTYRTGTGKTEAELQALSTNWIINKWPDLLKEGVRAKAFKRLGDEIRMRASYSQFESMKTAMQNQEQWSGGPFFMR